MDIQQLCSIKFIADLINKSINLTMSGKKQGGLAGMIAGNSAISTVGLGSGLNYRGYNIVELAQNSTFEEVAYLLLKGSLPAQQDLHIFRKKIAAHRTLPPALIQVIEKIPKDAHPMEVMRTICSFLGVIEPESPSNPQDDIAVRLIALYGPAICYWWHFSQFNKKILLETSEHDTIAENFCKLILQQTVLY